MAPRRKILNATLAFFVLAAVLTVIWRCAPSVSDDAYRVGVVLPLTGDSAQWGVAARRGAELAIDEINSGGGINGRNIQLIVEDSRCSPRDGVSAFNKLLTATRPGVVLGGVCSSVTLAIAPIAERERVVLVSPASTNPDISQAGDFIFRVIPSDDLRGRVFADYLYDKKGFSQVAILYVNNEGGVGNRNAFRERFTARGGTIVAEETYTQDATDVRSQLTRLRSSDAQGIVVVSYPRDTVIVLRQTQELGVNVPLFFQTEAVEDANVLREAGKTAEGVTYILPAAAEGDTPDSFRKLYRERHASDPELFAAEAYDTIMLIRNYLSTKESEALVAENLRDYLYGVRNYSGASGTISFDEHGDVRKPMAIRTIQDGQPETIEVLS